jgi:hypothetical protein
VSHRVRSTHIKLEYLLGNMPMFTPPFSISGSIVDKTSSYKTRILTGGLMFRQSFRQWFCCFILTLESSLEICFVPHILFYAHQNLNNWFKHAYTHPAFFH